MAGLVRRTVLEKLGGQLRQLSVSCRHGGGEYNFPMKAGDLPLPAGISSMLRLPVQKDTKGLDACFVGVPLDIGVSNRTGTRFGPRQIRAESVTVRPFNKETGASPFESLQVADIGDVNFTLYDLKQACDEITEAYKPLIANGCKTLSLGGDHTLSWPILRAYKEKYGPVGLIHVDAHADTNEVMNKSAISHGSPFRLAVMDGLLDCKRVVQIGLRASGHAVNALKWGMDQGFRVVPARDCWYKSLEPLMAEVREQMGDGPVYLSFDIDGLDPAHAWGTGTPEIGGLTSVQGLEIVRGCRGLNIVGGDLVEVSPPYDTTGTTAHCAASLLFEMLCILPGVKYDEIPV